jgi:uncharacterized protein YqhQ
VSAGPDAPLRIGGMAMGDGVVMRSEHYWALARADGSLDSGPVGSVLERHARLRLPFLRSVVSFFEMMGFAVERHKTSSRRRNVRLLCWIAAYAAVGFALNLILPAVHEGALLDNALLQVLGVALSLLVLWLGMGRELWRFHGAEHMAVNAHEAGADMDDLAAVARHSRIHDRCGTNLVVIVLVLMAAYVPMRNVALSEVVGALWALAAIAISFELFKLLVKWPKSPFTRVVLFGGRLMQRWLTTRDPEPEQLRVACAALKTVAGLEAARELGVVPPPERRWALPDEVSAGGAGSDGAPAPGFGPA